VTRMGSAPASDCRSRHQPIPVPTVSLFCACEQASRLGGISVAANRLPYTTASQARAAAVAADAGSKTTTVCPGDQMSERNPDGLIEWGSALARALTTIHQSTTIFFRSPRKHCARPESIRRVRRGNCFGTKPRTVGERIERTWTLFRGDSVGAEAAL
jgi:hypothetical protein